MKNNTRCINRILANEESLISYKKDKFRHHIMIEFYFIWTNFYAIMHSTRMHVEHLFKFKYRNKCTWN